jgi:hypothetical protein
VTRRGGAIRIVFFGVLAVFWILERQPWIALGCVAVAAALAFRLPSRGGDSAPARPGESP